MATCAVMGQAAGTAAALTVRARACAPRSCTPTSRSCAELQQTLLRDDQTINGRKNQDPADLARKAKVTASGEAEDAKAEHVTSTASSATMPGEWTTAGAPNWGRTAPGSTWPGTSPSTLRRVQITFDTGFHRELTLTSSDGINGGIIRAPQPETVKDYQVLYRNSADGKWEILADVKNNHQRLVRHEFSPVSAQAIRLVVTATNGEKLARVFEVRCYS